MEPLWIIGGGGHAKVVIDTARSMGVYEPIGILDDDATRLGQEVLGVRIRGQINLDSILGLGIKFAVVAIGNNRVRKEMVERVQGVVSWVTLVHSSAVVAPTVQLGAGTVVFAGVVLQPDAGIGDHTIINTSASIDHDSRVGDYVHIAPGVHLAGNVCVEHGAFLGIGSCVIPGNRFGAWSTLGAGSVLTQNLPDGVIAKGVPARWSQVDEDPNAETNDIDFNSDDE